METNEECRTEGFYDWGCYKWTGGCGGVCCGYGTVVATVLVVVEC